MGPKNKRLLKVSRPIHNLYASPNIIRVIKSRKMKWVGYVARMGETRNAYEIFVGNPEGKRPLRRPRHRWEVIRMDLMETGWEGVDWMHLAQDRDQWQAPEITVMNLRVP
jgi:hypothetical protein